MTIKDEIITEIQKGRAGEKETSFAGIKRKRKYHTGRQKNQSVCQYRRCG